MIAVLSRLLGINHIDTAEDIVQDTLLQAMSTWPFGGIPQHPSAWLYRVAKNKAIDYLRRKKRFRIISTDDDHLMRTGADTSLNQEDLFLDEEIKDSQLRMIFVCCHPSIAQESQIAFVLKTLCGLSTAEIARAFLVPEETIAKRIYRAKEKIRTEKLNLELPSPGSAEQRLDAVLQSLYLLFNEGYNSSHPDHLIREELCEEAIRLAYLLTLQNLTDLSKTRALLSLFCFQSSRLKSRLDEKGNIILLRHQDRKLWHWPLIEKGFAYLEAALEGEHETSAYHLEAAIASLHASSTGFEETDWKSICFLYDHLYELKPGPIIALNRAIASGFANTKHDALDQLLSIHELDNYYLYQTSLGETYFELGRKQEARLHFQKALLLTPSRLEQEFLQKKIRNCTPESMNF